MSRKSRKVRNFTPPVIVPVTTFDFPPEIEDMIIEWTALSFPGQAPSLSVLSRRIQRCVEKTIYETLFVVPSYAFEAGIARASRAILPALKSRPAEFFMDNVRNLIITKAVPKGIVKKILSKCAAIRHLVLTRVGSSRLLASTSSRLSLTSIFTKRHILRDMAACGLEFPNISTLGVLTPIRSGLLPTLSWMPSLEIVQLDLYKVSGRDELDKELIQDIDTIFSTTPCLRLLLLKIFPCSIYDLKDLVRRRKVQNSIDRRIELAIRDIHYSPGFIEEWRRTYKGEMKRDYGPGRTRKNFKGERRFEI